MTEYEEYLHEELKRKSDDLYGRIEAMLKICREHLSHKIMMELIDIAYPSASREVERHDHEA